MKEITVIIPTYNKAIYLDLTFAGYVIQDFKDFEIIIIDDGSMDNTKDIVKKYSDKLKINYIYQENSGRSAAKNTALDHVKSKYVIFADDDRIPAKSFISQHLKLLKENHKCVTIGSKFDILSFWNDNFKIPKKSIKSVLLRNKYNIETLLNNERLITSETLMSSFEEVIKKYYISERTDNYIEILDRYGENLKNFHFGWAITTTGNMGFEMPKKRIYFDCDLKGWGGEDNEFAFQLYKLGYNFMFAVKAINYHQYHNRGKDEMTQLRNNILHMMEKHSSYEIQLFYEVLNNPVGVFTFIDANDRFNIAKQ